MKRSKKPPMNHLKVYGRFLARGLAIIALTNFPNLSSAKAENPPQKGTLPIIIDVRTPQEFEENHVVNAVNIDFLSSDFETRVKKLSPGNQFQLYCRSGSRSARALSKMQQLGVQHVHNLGSLSEAAKRLNAQCTKGPC